MNYKKVFYVMLVIIGLLASSCSSNKPEQNNQAGAVPVKDGKPDFSALEHRELPPMQKKEFSSEDGYLRAKTEWKTKPAITYYKEGSYYYIPLNIGTIAPLECYVYKERLDMASSLVNIQNALAGQFKIAQKEIKLVNASAFDEVPYLRVDLAYLNESKLYGNLKVIVGSKNSNSVICVHNEVGYSESFKRIVSDLLTSFSVNSDSYLSSYKYKTVSIVELNSQKVGLVESYVIPIGNSELFYAEYSSMLIPRSKSDLVSLDKFVGESIDQKGILKEANYVTVKNNEVDMELRLKLGEKGLYFVKGKFMSKDVKMDIKSQRGLKPRFIAFKEIQDHFYSKRQKSPKSYFIYSPDINPSEAIEVKYQYLGDLKQKRIKLEESIGKLKSTTIIDDKGPLSAVIPFAGTAIKMERIIYDEN